MTEEQIQEIKQSLAAATPGKWEVNDFDMMYSAEIISEHPNGVFNGIASGMYVPNAQLIANSPTWLNQLLEALELKESEYQSAIDKVNRSTKLAQEYQQQNKQLIEVLKKVNKETTCGVTWSQTHNTLQQIQGKEKER